MSIRNESNIDRIRQNPSRPPYNVIAAVVLLGLMGIASAVVGVVDLTHEHPIGALWLVQAVVTVPVCYGLWRGMWQAFALVVVYVTVSTLVNIAYAYVIDPGETGLNIATPIPLILLILKSSRAHFFGRSRRRG